MFRRFIVSGFPIALVSCTVASPPKTPEPVVHAAARIEMEVQPRVTPMELLPGRVRSAYASKSEVGSVEYKRDATGWRISAIAPPSTAADHGEWAGFCWDVVPVNAKTYSSLVIDLPEVSQEAEVDIKLERQDNRVQEAVQQYLKRGSLDIDLGNFPKVRAEVARLCIMAIGRPGAPSPTAAKFVVARAGFR